MLPLLLSAAWAQPTMPLPVQAQVVELSDPAAQAALQALLDAAEAPAASCFEGPVALETHTLTLRVEGGVLVSVEAQGSGADCSAELVRAWAPGSLPGELEATVRFQRLHTMLDVVNSAGPGRGATAQDLFGGPSTGDLGMPRPSVEVEVVAAPEALRERVTRVARSYTGIARACYQRQLLREPTLAGRLELWAEVADGKVTEADVVGAGLGGLELGHCVRSSMLRWRFPEELSGRITLGWELRPGE